MQARALIVLAALTLAACSGTTGSGTSLNVPQVTAPAGSIAKLNTITTIGSTIDAGSGAGAGDNNPYGLTIAPLTAGSVIAGDLLVCNFNNAAGTQGAGTTIEDIKPAAGSAPVRIAQSSSLQGCNALAVNSKNGAIWAADYTANNNPIVSATGSIVTTLSQNPWYGPWGQAFNGAYNGKPAFFATNAKNGTVVRINILPGPTFSFDTILSGLSSNNGAPGNILAPAGLTYDGTSDTLYVVDSNANRVLAIHAATTTPAGTSASGSAFTSSNISVVFSGLPLAAPISSALLANGDLVVANTANNYLVEINPSNGAVVASKNLDTGAPGALFGLATIVVNNAQYVYFNDDNSNSVNRLSP